ncbi:bifunctional DNA primase/polymerase [Jiangella sp. DSM 45060]|uniref:bifunctional DNA primase/polymerase n=1 Tax=Jiangella sp. DSM 45060 TaxID=1798224 RepID=UPI00087A81E6|nr:bifunctional DNA primase/polymerase [Jiangella sp. DSM 45060]SDT36522.1 Bifunctional DNA primase/polymerase, N-terminal [Jiangella sp. DSM 45060]
MTMGDEAVAFAAAGIPVFPCWPGAKHPLTEHGFEEATTDLGQVRAWWRTWPNANLAMPTGTPLWDVLDVDMKNGESGYPALRRLKQAGLLEGWSHAVQTPSGGLHLYFAGTDEGNHALYRHKIDYRGAGGYVLLPPSIVDRDRGPRRYETIEVRDPDRVQAFSWAAARDLLQPPTPTPPAPVHGHASADRRMPYLVDHVRNAPEGNRNNALFWAANRALDNGSADLGPLVAAAVEAGLDYCAAAATAASAQRSRSGSSSRRASPQAPPAASVSI